MTELARFPRSVLVAPNPLYHELSQDPDRVGLLEDLDAMIIPYSATAQVNEQQVAAIRLVLEAAGQLTAGSLLIKNPYDAARYEFAEFAIEAFAGAKYHALANVARLLGAREIHFIEAKVDQNKVNMEGGAKFQIPAGAGQLDVSTEVTKRLEERLEGQMKFPGSAPAPEEALAYLSRRFLSNDQHLTDLVEMRTGANLISDYKMTLNGTRESAANLKSGLNLARALPATAIEFAAAFTRTAESISSIEITTEITF